MLAVTLMAVAMGPATAATRLDGEDADPFEDRSAAAVVLAFVSPECPISNRLAPELRRIYAEYAPRGVRFFLVYPEIEVDAAAAREHAAAYGYPFPALLDHDRGLTRMAGASILSEVAVLSSAGELLYRGRVNDRFIDFGKTRPEPTRHDLRDALGAIVDGHEVAEPRTVAIGCFIPPLGRGEGG